MVLNQEFVAMPPDELGNLLSNDDLNVSNEEVIFHALVMWAKQDTANRKKYLSKLLNCVKLPLLTPQARRLLNLKFKYYVVINSFFYLFSYKLFYE